MIMKEICIENNNKTNENYSNIMKKCKVFATRETVEMNYVYITLTGDVKEVKKAIKILTK